MSERTKDKDDVAPGVGVDVGTSNICVARRKADKSFAVRHHRNMLFEVEDSDETQSMLETSGFLYVKTGGRCYVVGEDALRLVNMIGRGEIVRPMQNGLLNPDLGDAKRLLFHILKAVVGDPVEKGECLRFSVPANPVDLPDSVNNAFHQGVLEEFFASLGYSPRPVNEALANLHYCAPIMKVQGESDRQMTGYSTSWGAGMTNTCVALQGMPIRSTMFSITRSGDHIDKQVSAVTGTPVGRVIRIKETRLDLDKVDPDDNVQVALSIYYDEMIGRVVRRSAKVLVDDKRTFDGPVEVVVCGGTAMVPGFVGRLRKAVAAAGMPFEVADVRLADRPFFSVSQGACLLAAADQSKAGR